MQRNTILFGILVALLTPFVAYLILTLLNQGLETLDFTTRSGGAFSLSRRLILLMSVCANVIPFEYFRRYYFDNAMRGVVVPTLVYLFAWAFTYDVFKF